MSHVNAVRKSFLVLVAALFAAAGCNKKIDATNSNMLAPTGNEILIGEVGSLTGNEATFGTSTRDGIQLAVDQVNAAGGIQGKKLKVLVMDNQGKPEESATAATKLITQDNILALLGEVASSRSLAMAPIAQANKVPMISPSSTNPKVTQVGDYIFRVCFIDPFQGAVMAHFARETLKVRKVAILRDIKNDYSVGLANFFAETLRKLGGEITTDQSYSSGDVDFKSQLTSIKAKNPEAIYVPGYYTEAGLIARQAREIGIKVPLMGGDGWDSAKLTEIGGPALHGSYFSNHYSPDDVSPLVQKFIADYKARYAQVPDSLAAMAYDALLVLADAMKRARTLTREDIRKAIAETKDFQAVTGKITIDKDRNAVKPAVIIEIKPTGFAYKATVNPSS